MTPSWYTALEWNTATMALSKPRCQSKMDWGKFYKFISYKLYRNYKIYLSEWGSWSDCSTTCGEGIQTRTRTCAYDAANFSQSLTEQKTCQIQECCNDTWTSWSGYGSCSDHGAGPYKRQRSRQKFVQVPACSQEGKTVQYDYQTQDCSYTGDWGTGKLKKTVKVSFKEL